MAEKYSNKSKKKELSKLEKTKRGQIFTGRTIRPTKNYKGKIRNPAIDSTIGNSFDSMMREFAKIDRQKKLYGREKKENELEAKSGGLMKVTRLKSGGFVSSGTDAGDLKILRTAKNIDDGSANGMKSGGAIKKKKKTGSDLTVEEIRRIQKRINEGKTRIPSNLQRMQKNMKEGGKTKSRVNEAGNYTKPGLRKRIFNRIKAGGKGGRPGQWSARKAQMMAKAYKKAGGGYK